MARVKKETKKQKTLLEQGAPQDPRFIRPDAGGVAVSIDGQDFGTPARHGKGQMLDAGKSAAAIPGKIGGVAMDYIEIEKKIVRVARVQNVLDLMARNKTITTEQYSAGKRFQFYFDLSNQSHVTTISFDRQGGSVSREDFLAAQINATNHVEAIFDVCGGRTQLAGRALECVVGRGMTFDYMATYTGLGKHYWRGALVTALGILVGHFDKRKRNQRHPR